MSNKIMSDDNKAFWNKTAAIYKKFTYGGKKAQEAYESMVAGICQQLGATMDVLELAAGPGVLSFRIAQKCKSLEATDFSETMIAEAKKKVSASNLHFSIQDATDLPFATNSFDAVVIANALHIMPNPDMAMKNISRVLKHDGILICPTFTRENDKHGLMERLMEFVGFRTYSRWNQHGFEQYIDQHGFIVIDSHQIYGHNFPITFIVAKKNAKC